MTEFRKAVILGATGPTGKHLVPELLAKGVAVRVVSRSAANLEKAFSDMPVARLAADVLDQEGVRNAVEGCDLVFDCVGLPADRLDQHPLISRHVAEAIGRTGAKCVYVSGYWAYIPIGREVVSEKHPRSSGPLAAQWRREAEDILREAGAAIMVLPDFYGPEVHFSTLQRALGQAVAGQTVQWIGSPETLREYVFVPDAMKAVAELAFREEAYGDYWVIPGAGPVSFNEVLEIASSHLGRKSKVQAAGMFMLRLMSLFMRELRYFLPLVPTYSAPVSYDAAKTRALLGDIQVTPYDTGIPRTLDWLAK